MTDKLIVTNRLGASLRQPYESTDPAPIGLAEFAAISERTEPEYQHEMFRLLNSGRLLDLLTCSAQADLGSWIEESGHLNGGAFVVVFNLSQNRLRNVALHCLCRLDMSGDEPKIEVVNSIPGFSDRKPKETVGKEGFEIFFCDMNPNI